MLEHELKNVYIGEVWTPGANTLAYWKLDGNLNDETGNYNLTNSGTSFYNDTSIGRQVLYCDGNSQYVYTTSLPSTSIDQVTINIWSKGRDLFHANRNLFDTWLNSDNGGIRWECNSSGIQIVFKGYYPDTGVTSSQANSWGLWTITFNRTTKAYQIFFSGVLKSSGTASNIPNTSWLSYLTLGLGYQVNNYRSYYGYIGETVIENKIWTQDDVTSFYDLTKANYGL